MVNKLEETDWELLLERIKDGNCTPFLGAGACIGEIPIGSQIVNEWAKKYDYPMDDSYNLIRVAQFVAVMTDQMKPKGDICKKIEEQLKEATSEYFEIPGEPHAVLADLPLPVYITTNYDDFMVRALESRGKVPVQETCRIKGFKKPKRRSSYLDPTPEKPLVYHLHGYYKEPESLILTEDDYLEFLVAISKEQNLLPEYIQGAFSGASLLFLGYSITDWDFRVLFRILDEYLKISLVKNHISVQLVTGDLPDPQKEKIQKYLDRYFAKLEIKVYWQDCHEFAAELKSRWEAFTCNTNKKATDKINALTRDYELRKTIPSITDNDQFKTGYELTGQFKEEMNKVSILFLAADPTEASRLRLGEEFREIQRKLDSSTQRDRFKLELPQFSVISDDILKAMNKFKPNIVHFSGHGTSTGELCIENEVGGIHTVEPDALAALFKQFSGQVNCVLLNACFSKIQADAISKHIKYVIGMNQEIHDEAAIAFAKGFYLALGEGSSIEDSYNCGCIEIQLQNIPGHLTPVLIKKGRSQLLLPNKIENTVEGCQNET